jgi:hypothetical protein
MRWCVTPPRTASSCLQAHLDCICSLFTAADRLPGVRRSTRTSLTSLRVCASCSPSPGWLVVLHRLSAWVVVVVVAWAAPAPSQFPRPCKPY